MVRRDGSELRTLRDATNYIAKLPKRDLDAPAWQAAMQALLLVAEHGGDIRAAVNAYHAEHTLSIVPKITCLRRPGGRHRWLTRNEAARLLGAAIGYVWDNARETWKRREDGAFCPVIDGSSAVAAQLPQDDRQPLAGKMRD
jgi:hypothetical protein